MPNRRLSFYYFFYANCECVIDISGSGIKCDSVFCNAKLLRFMKAYLSVKVNRLMLDLCEKARCPLHVARNTRLSLFGVSDLFFTSGRVVIKRTCVERRNLRVTSRTVWPMRTLLKTLIIAANAVGLRRAMLQPMN